MIHTEAWFRESSWRERLDSLWDGVGELDASLPEVGHLRKRVEGLERFILHQGSGMCEPGRLSVRKALDAMEGTLQDLLSRRRYR